MFQNYNKYIDFLVEHQLTHEQFMFLYILHMDSLEMTPDGKRIFPKEGPAIASIWKYAQAKTPWTRTGLQDLIDRGFLRFCGAGDRFVPDLLEVTEQFRSLIFVGNKEVRQFYDAYPNRMKAGVSLGAIKTAYERSVITLITHLRIMEVLQWGIRNEVVNWNIRDWIGSQRWIDVEAIRRCRLLRKGRDRDITCNAEGQR